MSEGVTGGWNARRRSATARHTSAAVFRCRLQAHNPPDDTVFRWMGLTLTQLSAANLVVSRSKDQARSRAGGQRLCRAPAGWLGGAAPSYTGPHAASSFHSIIPLGQDNVKDYLKFAGAGWLTCAAYTAYNASEGIQKRDISLASAAGMATMGSLCLWRGFSDD